MRGLIRDIPQRVGVMAKAKGDLVTQSGSYRAGEVFTYVGDPVRLTGLADLDLLPFKSGHFYYVSWMSPFHLADGYGRLATDTVKAMTETRRIGTSIADIGWIGERKHDPQVDKALGYDFLLREVLVLMTPPDDGLIHSRHVSQEPTIDALAKKQFRVLYTMIEYDRLQPSHVAAINAGADLVVVPSKFLVDVFKQSGVTRPVVVATNGINETLWTPGERQQNRWAGKVESEVRFLMTGNMTRRKNVETAIKVFEECSAPNWRLIIKTQKGDQYADSVLIPALKAKDSRITVIPEQYDEAAMLRLYQSADVFLWTSYGEGLGLTPLEAMACGLEVVLPDSSGMSDYIAKTHCYPVPTNPVTVPAIVRNDGAQWWAVDEVALAEQMKLAAAAKGAKSKGAKARAYIEKNRNKDVTGASWLSILENEVAPRLPEK